MDACSFRYNQRQAQTAAVKASPIVLSLQFLMKKAGFEVRVARDGDEALAEVSSRAPDLILLDMQGRQIKQISDPNGSGRIVIEARDLAAGSYIYQLSGAVNATGKLVLEL